MTVTYIPQTNTTGTAQQQSGSFDWIDALIRAYGAYSASKPGKFRQEPESPDKIALRNRILGFIDNSPTRNALGGILDQYAKGARIGGDFRLPTSKTYDPNPSPPYTGPNLDVSALTHLNTGAAPPSPNGVPPPSGNPPPGGGSGPQTPFTGNGPGNPFTDLPNTAPNTQLDWGQIHAAIDKYGPSAMTIASAIASANPFLAVAGIVKGVQAYFGGDKTAGGNVKPETLPPLSSPQLPDTTPAPTPGGSYGLTHPDYSGIMDFVNNLDRNGKFYNADKNFMGGYTGGIMSGGSQEGSDWGNMTNRTQFNTPRGGRGISAV